jgi:hypothetical protein
MRLPRNRWFSVVDGKTTFKFGQHAGDALEDVLLKKDGPRYLEYMQEFDDMTPEVREFIEAALVSGSDPISGGNPEPPRAMEDRLTALQAKAKEKQRVVEEVEKKSEIQETLKKRKNEAPW